MTSNKGHLRITLAAQSTVEYLILFSTLLIVFLIMTLTSGNQIQEVTTNVLKERAMSMDASTAALDGSDPNIPAIGAP